MRNPTPFMSLLALVSLAAPGISRAQGPASGEERFIAGEAMNIEIPLDTASFLKGGYAVDSAGYVELPVLGRLQVGDKNREDVENYLSQKLSNYLKDTHIM